MPDVPVQSYHRDFVALVLLVNPRLFGRNEALVGKLLDNGVPDWVNVHRYAERHRVVPLLANRLRDLDWFGNSVLALDSDQVSALKTVIRMSAFAEMSSLAEIKRVLKDFGNEGIDSILIKGLVLSQLCFDVVGRRTNRDIDLLIDVSQVDRGDAILQSLGYIRIEPHPELSIDDFREWKKNHKDCVYHHPTRRIVLELHYRLFDNAVICYPEMTNQTEKISLFSQIEVNSLRRPQLMIYLAMHGAMHGWSRLKWLIDFAILSGEQSDPLAAELTGGQISDAIGRRAVATANALCNRFFGEGFPATSRSSQHLDFQTRLLFKASHHCIVGAGPQELEDTRFGTTIKNLSHYLLSQSPRYVVTELRYDLTDMSRDANAANSKIPQWLRRPAAWVRRRL